MSIDPHSLADAGQIRDLTPDARGSAVIDSIGHHRAAILDIDARLKAGELTSAERLERTERMQGEMAATLKAVKASERIVWEPSGDSALLDARFLDADGTPRFWPTKERVDLAGMPGFMLDVPGLLTDERPVTRGHQEVVAAYRAFAISYTMVRNGWREAEPLKAQSWKRLYSALNSLSGRTGEFCRSMLRDPAMFQRVINNVAGAGGELISNPTISTIRRPLILERRLAGLVPRQSTNNTTFKQAAITGHGLARLRGATTDAAISFTNQRFTTADSSISMKDMVVNALVDPNWLQDVFGVLADPIGEIQRWLDQSMADTFEAALLHGDSTATHEDTLTSWTLGNYFTAGQLDGADSPLRFWKGLRRRAVDDSVTGSASGSFTAATHWGRIGAMGNHGSAAVMIMGLSTFYLSILANTLFTSYNAMGAAGTFLTGKLGAVGSTPIVISEFMPKEFSTVDGLYTGSNKGNAIVYADLGAYMYYMMANGAGDYDVSYPERGARYLGMTDRAVLVANVPSGEIPVSYLYNT